MKLKLVFLLAFVSIPFTGLTQGVKDVDGWSSAKWGMTLAQVQAAMKSIGLPIESRPEQNAKGSIDVWESVEAYDHFVQSTLVPAMGKVAAARGLDRSKMGEPEVKITEIHRLVRKAITLE